MHQAAQGTGQVSLNISGVKQAASESGVAAGDVLLSAEEMSGQSTKLRSDLDNFIDKIRAT